MEVQIRDLDGLLRNARMHIQRGANIPNGDNASQTLARKEELMRRFMKIFNILRQVRIQLTQNIKEFKRVHKTEIEGVRECVPR